MSRLLTVLICLSSAFALTSRPTRRQLHALPSTTDYPANPYAVNYINASRADFSPVHLTIDTKDKSKRNATAPNLYGVFHEDVSHSGDGGIYAELLMNRAFQGSEAYWSTIPQFVGNIVTMSENELEPWGPTLTGWEAVGNVSLHLDRLHPLSPSLPLALQIDIPVNTTGEVGIMNTGWWGIDVSPQRYNASFHVLTDKARYNRHNNATTFTISLRSNLTGETFVNSTIDHFPVDSFAYTQLNATLKNTATAPNSNNTFLLTMNGTEVSGQTFYFSLFSLFPETYKNTKLRKDIAQVFADMRPGFLRFPGGGNLLGFSPDSRFKWFEHIGPLKDRPGRVGSWGYYNTGGMGLLEYLEWAEVMDMEIVLAVFDGFASGNIGPTTDYPQYAMPAVLQEALDELEYCMGDTSTYWGGRRAADGHPAPFKVNYVEIGNEDFFSDTAPRRFQFMYDGLHKAYPNITLIASAFREHRNSPDYPYNITIPEGAIWDAHVYSQPSYFVNNFNQFDNFQESNDTKAKVLLGEFNVYEHDTVMPAHHLADPPGIDVVYPSVLAAIAEGVWLLGAERNPNVVEFACYAPCLANRNDYIYTPNLITFDAFPNNTVPSVSYWQEWLFSHHRGSHTLLVTNDGPLNPLFWGSTIDEKANSVYLKLINTGNNTVPLTVTLDKAWTRVNGTMIQDDDPNAYNDVGKKDAVMPRTLDSAPKKADNGSWTWTVPKFSITVLQFD